MLIYNQNKKLIGVDDEDLNTLGFTNINEFLAACQDVAELFVKKPGYIHDFKNFQWIDFVLHADAEASKAIVQTAKKHFSCDIEIKPFYLTETPDQAAYAVHLKHIHPLSGSEEAPAVASPEPVAPAIEPEPVPTPTPEPTIAAAEPEPFTSPEIPSEEPAFAMPEPASFETTDEEEIPAAFSKPLEIEEDIYLEAEPEPIAVEPAPAVEAVAEAPAAAPSAAPAAGGIFTPDEQEYIDRLTVPSDYVFNPQVAADELGLPVDLIEEFIGDFISQSHEFHDELFSSASKADFDNVKILSHKLKGVAANLRVEDALEMLTIVNNSHDQIEVEANLKAFYRVIDKLEGKEVPDITPSAAPVAEAPAEPESVQEAVATEAEPAEEDIYAFDLPTSEPEIEEPVSVTDDAVAAQAPEATEEDIYAFDLPSAEPEIEEPGLAEEPFAQAPEAVEEDIYAFDLPATEPEIEEPSAVTTEEELYTADTSAEEPQFKDEEVELPPMDMSLLEEETQATEEPALEPAPAPAATLHYDAQQAAAELGLPLSLVQELQQDFAADAKTCKSEMETAIASSEIASWQSCAATLKGAADNLRMTEIAETLKTLTQTNDPQEAETSMSKLYNYVDQL